MNTPKAQNPLIENVDLPSEAADSHWEYGHKLHKWAQPPNSERMKPTKSTDGHPDNLDNDSFQFLD